MKRKPMLAFLSGLAVVGALVAVPIANADAASNAEKIANDLFNQYGGKFNVMVYQKGKANRVLRDVVTCQDSGGLRRVVFGHGVFEPLSGQWGVKGSYSFEMRNGKKHFIFQSRSKATGGINPDNC
jgi:hypothetical protein